MYRTVRMTFFSTHSSSIIRHCEPDTKQGQKNYGKASRNAQPHCQTNYLKDVRQPDTLNLAWILRHVMTHSACLSVPIITLALTHICQCLAAHTSGRLYTGHML